MLNLTALLSKNVSFNAYIIFLNFHFLLLENQAVWYRWFTSEHWLLKFLETQYTDGRQLCLSNASPSQTLLLRKPPSGNPSAWEDHAYRVFKT